MNQTTHFLIVTALDEERDAILRRFSLLPVEPRSDDVRRYWAGELKQPDRPSCRIVLVSLARYGRVEAATTVGDAIRAWQPQKIILAGICGGVAERGVAIGDVVVSEQVVDYEVQKITPVDTEVKWQAHQSDARLLGAARALGVGWQSVVDSRPESGTPQVHFAAVASGDKVVADNAPLKKLLGKWPSIAAVEMEAAGVAAASSQSVDAPGFLMVKAVSDLADGDKNSTAVHPWRAYACELSAAYVAALIASGPLPVPAANRRFVQPPSEPTNPSPGGLETAPETASEEPIARVPLTRGQVMMIGIGGVILLLLGVWMVVVNGVQDYVTETVQSLEFTDDRADQHVSGVLWVVPADRLALAYNARGLRIYQAEQRRASDNLNEFRRSGIHRARRWFQRSRDTDPDQFIAYWNLACMEALLGNADASVELLQEMERRLPDARRAYYEDRRCRDPDLCVIAQADVFVRYAQNLHCQRSRDCPAPPAHIRVRND